MPTMSDAQWRAFVSEGTRTGKLAVTRANGAPHVTPVWFLLDGDDILFNTGSNSLKGKALRRDPRFALCVDEAVPPYSFVILEAEARIIEDLDEVALWAARLGGRYMGADRAEEFGRRNGVPGELLVRGRIIRVTAVADVAD